MLQLKVPNSRAVKSTVKSSLEGRLIPSGVAGIIPYLLYLLISIFTGVFSMIFRHLVVLPIIIFILFSVFLLAPVLLGAVRWFWRATDGCQDSATGVFYYLSSIRLYKRALKCVTFLIYKCFIAVLVCLSPYFVVSVISNSWIYQFLGTEVPLWVAGLALVESFLRTVGILASVVVSLRYYLFPALVVMDENMLLLEAMHISVMVSRRSITAFIGLVCSYIGWILLSFAALPLFYTAPMFFAAYAVHSRFAIVNYNQNLDRFKKQEFMF